jgi:hypothetical protein
MAATKISIREDEKKNPPQDHTFRALPATQINTPYTHKSTSHGEEKS